MAAYGGPFKLFDPRFITYVYTVQCTSTVLASVMQYVISND